jgi:hypothetical protein
MVWSLCFSRHLGEYELKTPSENNGDGFGVNVYDRGKEDARMTEQARRVENKAIPEWAQGLYYNSGLMKEVLVYYDDEAIYFEHKGKESGIVRFTFEMIEGLKIVEEEQSADSKE